MTFTKERLEQFINNPLEHGLTRGEQMEMARQMLASLEQEPVAWRYRYVHTPKSEAHGSYFTTDWVITHSEDECNPSDCFERQPLFAAPPAPVLIDERAAFNAWNNDENLPIAGVGAKNAAWLAWQARAAMLQGVNHD